MSGLHPLHLADLQKSDLTAETIRAAGIYTVPPNEIGKRLGGNDQGISSLLAFPYPGCEGYERFKCWYHVGKEGPKYRQKTGTSNRLYFPPGVELQGDPPLIIVEGEKKALALMQAGFQVIGIGGIWNWTEKGEGYRKHKETQPIPDFCLVNWKRPVTILFDSDGAVNPNVRLAAWRLAREAARRGGQVQVQFLPAGANGEKVGADDYLVEHGPADLGDLLKNAWPFDPALIDREVEINYQLREITPDSATLDKLMALSTLAPILAKMAHLEAAAMIEGLKERFKLRAKDLKGLEDDIKLARKKAQAKKGDSAAPALTDLEDVRRLHPAIDFQDEFMSIGFRVDLPDNESGLLLVISDGEGVKVEMTPEMVEMEGRTYQVKPGAPPYLRDVWGLDLLKSFMAHPTFAKLYHDLKEAYQTYLDLPEAAYGLMTAWTVGTYYAHLFTAFPFLHFHGPKESGKSKSLEAMRCCCFNAWKGRDITAAALGDTTDGQRGTLLLDQAEKLNSDEKNNLIGLLADSYKKAGGQRRVVEITKSGRSVLEFSTYGPKAFASTKPLDPDLADRCVKIPMTRTRRRLPDLEGWEPVWGELRDKLYRFTLAKFKTVRHHYTANSGNGTRIGELWRPLLAVLLALEVEQPEIEAIRTLFMEAAEEGRHEPTGWECALLEVVREKAQAHESLFDLTVPEIIEAMNIEGDKQPGGKWIGDTIGNYHLATKKTRPRINGRQITTYTFDPVRVKELCEIYFRETPLNVVNIVHSNEKPNDIAGISVHEEKSCSRTIVHSGEGVQDCSRTQNQSCTVYGADKINKTYHVHDVREKPGGISEKNINLFSGEEVEL